MNASDGMIVDITEVYNINAAESKNGKITVPSKSKVGEDVEIGVTPDKGYKLKNIEVKDDENNKIETVKKGEKYSFKMPARDVTVNTTFEKEIYTFTSEDKQEYKKDSNKGLIFTCTGDLSLLTNVYINNEELSSENYTLESGSTIITLKNEYLESLDIGEYELKLEYSNGEKVSTNFSVSEKEEEPIQTEEKKDEELKNTPKTGDRITVSISIIGILFLINLIIVIKNKK